MEQPTSTAIQAAAERLHQARMTSITCMPVRDLIGADNIDAAYAVQALGTARAVSEGRQIVGRKIGLTAESVQRQLGVNQPDFGTLLGDMAIGDGEEIAWTRVLQPKVEGEVALVLERDVTADMPTIADLVRATGYAIPAIEIVDSRISQWDIRIADTVADNASSGLFVLGGPPRPLGGLDLLTCGMVLRVNGRAASFGAGAACLGHPLNAAVWLARRLAAEGQKLRAGDLLLTGALGPMVAVKPGDAVEVAIGGLGGARAMFGMQTGG